MNLRRIVLVLFCVLLTAACEPKFKSRGALTIQGETFQPTSCQVTLAPGGITLGNADGAQLALVIPPTRVDAFRSYSFTPTVTFQARQDAPGRALGTCGTLTLRGEGYHGYGKRAVSGRVSLVCSGGATSGYLEFSGCF